MKKQQANKKRISIAKYLSIFNAVILFLFVATATFGQVKTVNDRSDIKISENLRYGDKPGGIGQDTSSDRTLDLYIPGDNANNKLPVLIFIHGGGFSGGDKMTKSNREFCMKIASHGYAVVSINYYLTLKHEKVSGASCSGNMAKGLPANGFHPKLQEAIRNASEDTQLALKWIKNNANKYKLDQTKVAISGGSAGGMTALYTAYVSNQKILPIKGVVNLWGGLENAGLIKKGAAPLLTYHGDLDKLIHVDYAYAIKRRMDEIGNQAVLHIMEGKGHARYDLITKEKIPEIADFLKATLK